MCDPANHSQGFTQFESDSPSDLIIPGLVTNGTAKICCRGLILVLF